MSEIKNLTCKMVKIMADTKRISKNGRNDHFKYDYVAEADVLEAVREILVKHNVFIYSSVIGTDRHSESGMTSVVMQHTFVDGDSGESFEVKSFGQGQDKTSDKGGPKAITSSMKYMLLKTLLLPTGDDPEATDETGKSTAPKVRALVPTDTGVSLATPKKYGFSGKSKITAPVTLVEGADEF